MTTFATDLLAAARAQALQTIMTAQDQINSIDEALARLVGDAPSQHSEHVAWAQGQNHVHTTGEDGAELAYAKPEEPPAEVIYESDVAVETGIEDGGDPGVVPVVPLPAAPEKKTGRRTNEELAADAGVSLEDVKDWLGAGQRVTKASIEEFAALHVGATTPEPEALVDEASETPVAVEPATAAEKPPWEQQAAPTDAATPTEMPMTFESPF